MQSGRAGGGGRKVLLMADKLDDDIPLSVVFGTVLVSEVAVFLALVVAVVAIGA